MHAVIRRWTGAAQLIEEMERRSQDVESVIGSTPGFVAYHAVRDGETLVTITVCRDKASTDESTTRAKQWVRDNVPAGAVSSGPSQITEGESFINFTSPQRLGATAPTA